MAGFLLNNSPFRSFNEPDQHLYIFTSRRLGLEFLQRLRGVEFRGEQNLVGMVNFANPLFAEAPALQPDGIQPVSAGISGGGGLRKREDVSSDGGPSANK